MNRAIFTFVVSILVTTATAKDGQMSQNSNTSNCASPDAALEPQPYRPRLQGELAMIGLNKAGNEHQNETVAADCSNPSQDGVHRPIYDHPVWKRL